MSAGSPGRRVHRTLKARAALLGMTLSDYLLKEISDVAERPTLDEVLSRLQERGRVDQPFDTAASVRAERAARR